MATLRQLETRLDNVVRRLERGVSRVMATVGASVGDEVVTRTPVVTGYARGNWRPSLNAPSEVPISFLDKTGQATISKIAAVAARYQPGDTLFIVNNAPYISRLNAGSSPQAPAGYIEAAVVDGTARALASFSGGFL